MVNVLCQQATHDERQEFVRLLADEIAPAADAQFGASDAMVSWAAELSFEPACSWEEEDDEDDDGFFDDEEDDFEDDEDFDDDFFDDDEDDEDLDEDYDDED